MKCVRLVPEFDASFLSAGLTSTADGRTMPSEKFGRWQFAEATPSSAAPPPLHCPRQRALSPAITPISQLTSTRTASVLPHQIRRGDAA
jgi:hypothetical protein